MPPPSGARSAEARPFRCWSASARGANFQLGHTSTEGLRAFAAHSGRLELSSLRRLGLLLPPTLGQETVLPRKHEVSFW